MLLARQFLAVKDKGPWDTDKQQVKREKNLNL
jgi:hypothetical protein